MATTTKSAKPKVRQRLLLSSADLWDLGIRFSKSQLYRKIEAGEFPRPVRLSAQRVAWRHDEIERWIKTRDRVEYAAA